MACHTCERRSRANFYNRYVKELGYASITTLMSAAYFAGLRFSDGNTRVQWQTDGALQIVSLGKQLSVRIHAGAAQATLYCAGKYHPLKEPEHAGFIIQGRDPPQQS